MLSIILLSYYSSDRINSVYNNLSELLAKYQIDFEFIVMDDGSKDNSYEIALNLETSNENVRAYQLSRNYTSHYSIFAGLSVAKGACVMPIVDDEQQPYETIVQAYNEWEKGEKIVIPYRTNREDPIVSKFFSNAFYQMMNSISDVDFPKGGADLFLIDREVVDIINERIHPIRTSSITEVLRLGFEPYMLPYDRPKGVNNKSRWSFKKKVNLALDNLFSSSSFPIKMIFYAGLLFFLFSFFLILLYLYIKIFGNEEFWQLNVPGWTSIFVIICFFSGSIMLSLSIIAQYIYRIFEEVKDRPGFIIKKK